MRMIPAALLAVGLSLLASAFLLKVAVNVTATLDQIERNPDHVCFSCK